MSTAAANTSIYPNSAGILDPNGGASTAFSLPGGIPSLQGIRLHHGKLVFLDDHKNRLFLDVRAHRGNLRRRKRARDERADVVAPRDDVDTARARRYLEK